MADIITILEPGATISDIVNHPSYQMYVPPTRNFSIPNYFGRLYQAILDATFLQLDAQEGEVIH